MMNINTQRALVTIQSTTTVCGGLADVVLLPSVMLDNYLDLWNTVTKTMTSRITKGELRSPSLHGSTAQ